MNGMHTAHVNMAKGFEGNIRHTLIQMCCNIEQCKLNRKYLTLRNINHTESIYDQEYVLCSN